MRVLGRTCTSSQVFLIAPVAQVTSTRSEPPTPAPIRTEIAVGIGPAAQLLGVLLLPTLKTKSLALIDACVPPPDKSTMMPLIPRE